MFEFYGISTFVGYLMPNPFLYNKTVLFQTIQFRISMQFSSIWPRDRTIRCYHSQPEWSWERWQWRGTPHSPKLQHYWNLTIRLFSVLSRILIARGVLPPLLLCREAVSVFYSPSWLGKYHKWVNNSCSHLSMVE